MTDYSQFPTERRNEASLHFDTLSTLDAVKLMSDADFEAARAVEAALPSIAAAVDAIAARMKNGGRLIYCGAGTSGRLGVLDASECPPTFGVDASLVRGVIAGGDAALRSAIEGAEDSYDGGGADIAALDIGENDTVAAISAGGSAAYCVGALDFAASKGALSVAVTCNPAAIIAAHAKMSVILNTGAEVLSGSTRLKAGTATKMTLNMLSTLTMTRLGCVRGNLMTGLKPTNAKLRDRAVRIIAEAAEVGTDEAVRLLDECGGVKAAIEKAKGD